MSLPPDLRARVLASARAEPAPTRTEARRTTALVVGSGFAASIALVLLVNGARAGGRPASLLYGVLLGWSAIAAVAVWGAFARGTSMLGRPRPLLVAIALATAPVLLAWALPFTATWPEGASVVLPMRAHLVCFVLTSVYALLPFAALAYARRGSDPVHPRASGAALGAAAGAFGGVLIDLHCPASSAAHVALGHVLPVAVLALVGAWVGRRLLGLFA